MWRGWLRSRRRPGYRRARGAWLADLRRDPTPNRVRRFGQALVLAAELPRRCRAAPRPFSAYAGLGRPLRRADRRPRLERFRRTPRTSGPRPNGRSARSSARPMGRHLHRSGARAIWRRLHPGRMASCCAITGSISSGFRRLRHARGAATAATRPVRSSFSRSAARCAKKGYDDLLAALALLPPDLAWRFVHIGGGALGARARSKRRRASACRERIEWRGAAAQPEVLAAYREADLFVLASKIAQDGDRDGLPNVLMEAQSQRLACISTDVSAIPELIEDGITGLAGAARRSVWRSPALWRS